MTSPLSSAVSSATLSILIDPSTAGIPGGARSLPFCRPASHLVRPAGHLQHAAATGACPRSIEAAVLASGFAGGGAFIGGFVGGAAGPVGPTADSSAFYPPPHIDSTIDGWHHPVAAAAAAAAAAVGLVGGGGGGAGGGWAFDPCRPIGAGYTNYGSISYGLDVRRKNATRESTSTLKAWLFDHIKNPYPTKGEKIMLAIITKMTLTQVSTWFANARRRLKKENKMQWPPRQRPNDEDDDDDEEEDRNSMSDENDDVINSGKDGGDRSEERRLVACSPMRSEEEEDDVNVDTDFEDDNHHPLRSSAHPTHQILSPTSSHSPPTTDDPTRDEDALRQGPDRANFSPRPSPATPRASSPGTGSHSPSGSDRATDDPAQKSSTDSTSEGTHEEPDGVRVKPRIWSLVDTATSGNARSTADSSGRDAFPVARCNGSFQTGSFQPWISISNGFHSAVVHPGLFGRTGCHVGALTSHRDGALQRTTPQQQTTVATFNNGTTCNGLKRAPPGEIKNSLETVATTLQTNQTVDVGSQSICIIR